MMFKILTEKEETEYRQWAHENYQPLTPINGVRHPIVQAECVRINGEISLSRPHAP